MVKNSRRVDYPFASLVKFDDPVFSYGEARTEFHLGKELDWFMVVKEFGQLGETSM